MCASPVATRKSCLQPLTLRHSGTHQQPLQLTDKSVDRVQHPPASRHHTLSSPQNSKSSATNDFIEICQLHAFIESIYSCYFCFRLFHLWKEKASHWFCPFLLLCFFLCFFNPVRISQMKWSTISACPNIILYAFKIVFKEGQ